MRFKAWEATLKRAIMEGKTMKYIPTI